jgi:hypothetical protein
MLGQNAGRFLCDPRTWRLRQCKPTHNIIYKARAYTGDDGQTKHEYSTIGAAGSDETGAIARLKLDTLPVSWDGVLYLRQRENDQMSST